MDALPLLGGDEVRKLLDPAQLRVALADGFVALSKGNVDVPPRIGARAPRGLLGAMPGYVPGAGLVVKVVSVFPAGPGPTHQGLVVLFDEHDGTRWPHWPVRRSPSCAPRPPRRSPPTCWPAQTSPC